MTKKLKLLKGVLWGTLIVVCLCSCGNDTTYYLETELPSSDEPSSNKVEVVDTQIADSVKNDIYVYVCGQIVQPGVYILPEGSRVYDLFEIAGGFTEKAAIDYWNQARLLKDGEMIYVPTIEEAEERHMDGNTSSQADTDGSPKVNINTASKEELMSLPGIGEAKALAILTYRQENGPFSSIEELKSVAGIKDGVFSKMKDYIEIN